MKHLSITMNHTINNINRLKSICNNKLKSFFIFCFVFIFFALNSSKDRCVIFSYSEHISYFQSKKFKICQNKGIETVINYDNNNETHWDDFLYKEYKINTILYDSMDKNIHISSEGLLLYYSFKSPNFSILFLTEKKVKKHIGNPEGFCVLLKNKELVCFYDYSSSENFISFENNVDDMFKNGPSICIKKHNNERCWDKKLYQPKTFYNLEEKDSFIIYDINNKEPNYNMYNSL